MSPKREDVINNLSRVRREAARKSKTATTRLFNDGGMLDSQTADTQIFGTAGISATMLSSPSPVRKRKFKPSIPSASPSKPKSNKEHKITDKPNHLNILEEEDRELEQKIEEGLLELGNKRRKIQGLQTEVCDIELELSRLLTSRYGRLKTILSNAGINGRNSNNTDSTSSLSPNIQESQTWEAHGHLAEEPIFPSEEAEIFHSIIDDCAVSQDIPFHFQ